MNTLLKLRKQRNMSQVELGLRAGCSPTTLLRIEKFGHRPPADCCHRIAAALGVTEAEIWPAQTQEVAQ